MDNTNSQNQRPRKDVSGSRNPFWNHSHSESSKALMRQKALERAKQYQRWKDSNKPMTMDEFLSSNPSVKEYITHLVRQQIQEMIWKEQKNK